MIIHALRWRSLGDSQWHAYKLGLGAGRFHHYQILNMPPRQLCQAAAALRFALTGRSADPMAVIGEAEWREGAVASPVEGPDMEVSLHFAVDAGHAWVLHRRPGVMRLLKDGTPIPEADAPHMLAQALRADAAPAQNAAADDDVLFTSAGAVADFFTLAWRHGGWQRQVFAAPPPVDGTLRDEVRRQIDAAAHAAAKVTGIAGLSSSATLVKLARALAPVQAQYRELARQFTDLRPEIASANTGDAEQIPRLAAELKIIDQISEVITPLIQPGVTLKGVQDELAKAEAARVELSQALGLQAGQARQERLDFRQPLECLARLEAQAQSIRAAQAVRKSSDQTLEPAFKRYLGACQEGLGEERPLVDDLQACLRNVCLRQDALRRGGHNLADEHASLAKPEGGGGRKTWFDRFKTRDGAEPAPSAPDLAVERELHELDQARATLEFALARLADLTQNAEDARLRHDATMKQLDQHYEAMVKTHGQLRQQWIQAAKVARLPTNLDVSRLLGIIMHHGRLVELQQRRDELAARVQDFQRRMTQTEALLIEWRQCTGSQKVVDITNGTILIAEARDVVRYREAKQKRLEQLRAGAAAAKAAECLRAQIKTRRHELQEAWRAAWTSCGILAQALDMRDERVQTIINQGDLIKALAMLLPTTTMPATPAFAGGAGLDIYLWPETGVSEAARLAFLEALDKAAPAPAPGSQRILLLADGDLVGLLGQLGIASSTRVAVPATASAGSAKGKDRESDRSGALATGIDNGEPILPPTRPVNRTPTLATPKGTAKPAEAIRAVLTPMRMPTAEPVLNERARQALAVLNGRKP